MAEPGRSWWQMTKTPKLGFMLGAFAGLLAVNGWLLVIRADDKTLGLLIAFGWSFLALAYVASATAMQRRVGRPGGVNTGDR